MPEDYTEIVLWDAEQEEILYKFDVSENTPQMEPPKRY